MTPVFQSFVAPARARAQLWRLVAGLALIVGIYAAWVSAVFVGTWWLTARDRDPGLWATGVAEGRTPGGTLVLLLTFAGMALGAMAAARWLHGRSPRTLFGSAAKTLRHFVVAASVFGALLAFTLVPWALRFDAVPNLPAGQWTALLPLAVALIVVQTGAEELLFRGYLQQQLAARFPSPLAWLILPAVIFGVVHYNPPSAGANTAFVIAAAALFGLVAGDLTARTGSIGAAWGLHFANNFMAIAVISTQGTITGLSRFTTPYAMDDLQGNDWLLAGNLLLMVLAWALLVRVFGR